MPILIKLSSLQKLFLSLLVSIIFTSFSANFAYACTQEPAAPWFTENVSFVETNLPENIGITTTNADYGQYVTITNPSDSPFFVQVSYGNGLQEFTPEISFSSDSDGLRANGYYIKSLESRNLIQDNRPDNVEIPEAQDTTVQLLLEQKQYFINLRISYELNRGYSKSGVEDYNNIKCPDYDEGNNQDIQKIIGLVAGLAVVLIVLIILVIREFVLGYKSKKR